MITQENLKECLYYDVETGVFTRKKAQRQRFVGKKAGSLRSDGYEAIKVLGHSFLSHRLAWFYVYGVWPENEIDHINHIRTDNRISNLRCVNKKQNAENRKLNKNTKTGFRGIGFSHTKGKFIARIRHNRKPIYLGSYDLIEDAIAAYREAASKLHTHNEVANEQNNPERKK